MFHKYIYLLGEKICNPMIQPTFKELKQSDFSPLEELQAIQLNRLKKLLFHAKDHSPFYADKLTLLDIENITLSDLSRIPILSKKDLYENIDTILNNPKDKKLIKSETSGSTGDALIFYRSQEWDAYHRAAQYRGYSWYNINPWDKNIYFWGFNPNWKELLKTRLLDFLMNRYRIFSFDDSILDKTSKVLKKCSYVEGYSSAVFELAQHMKKKGFTYSNVKLVKGTSEKVYDYYHDSVKNTFGQKMVSEYGAAETGIIAFECPYGNMHIIMENVIVEVIEDKIVVTNLHSDSFPIIRYELGDYVVLDNETKCPCGREHKIIKEVTGRVGKKIYGKSGRYPTLTLYYIFKNIALVHGIQLAYFGTQYKKGELELKVMQTKEDKVLLTQYILEESKKYFGMDVDIKVDFIQEFERNNKKIKDFESYIE